MPEHREQRLLASYGRRRGRRLRSGKQALMDGLLPQLQLSLEDVEMWRCGDVEISPHPPISTSPHLWLEIGFGGGEHLAHQARLHPEAQIIGCEPFINGIASLLSSIHVYQLNNIRIYNGDARLLIEKLPQGCLSRVFILYPDPWPKARHHKRRLISTEFLTSLARVMECGAQLRIATDDAEYCAWILEHVLAHPDFTWTAKRCADWLAPWDDWISTRYEQKALHAGRVSSYLNFVKV